MQTSHHENLISHYTHLPHAVQTDTRTQHTRTRHPIERIKCLSTTVSTTVKAIERRKSRHQSFRSHSRHNDKRLNTSFPPKTPKFRVTTKPRIQGDKSTGNPIDDDTDPSMNTFLQTQTNTHTHTHTHTHTMATPTL